MVAHAPCRFVGDAELPLDFFGRDAIPRNGKEKHHIKPARKGRAGLLERGASGWIDLIAAMLAGVGAASPRPVVIRGPMAALAVVPLAVFDPHDVL